MSALRDSGHAQQGTGQGGVAEDQRRNMKNDSNSEAEEALVKQLKPLASKLTADEKGYNLYMEQYLPLMGVHRSHAGQPESKEYHIGYLHFLDFMRRGFDPEKSGPSTDADLPKPKSLGCLMDEGRNEMFEISRTLLACSLCKSSSMRFELLQRDIIDVRLDSGPIVSGILFQPSLSCSSSTKKHLREVTVRLSLPESEGCEFLGAQEAPSGAECVAAYDIGGRVIFRQSTYAGNQPRKLLYVGHETTGSSSCVMHNSTTVEVQLKAPRGSEAVTHLSGQLLVCVADDQKLSYSMQVSVEAIVFRPPPRVQQLLLPCTSKEPQRKVYALTREVQIVLCDPA